MPVPYQSNKPTPTSTPAKAEDTKPKEGETPTEEELSAFRKYGPMAVRGIGGIAGVTPATGAAGGAIADVLAQMIEKGTINPLQVEPRRVLAEAVVGGTMGKYAKALQALVKGSKAGVAALKGGAYGASAPIIKHGIEEGDINPLNYPGEVALGGSIGALTGGGIVKVMGGMEKAPKPSIDKTVTARPRTVWSTTKPTARLPRLSPGQSADAREALENLLDKPIGKAMDNSVTKTVDSLDNAIADPYPTTTSPTQPMGISTVISPKDLPVGSRFAVADPGGRPVDAAWLNAFPNPKGVVASASPEVASDATKAALASVVNPKAINQRLTRARQTTAQAARAEATADLANNKAVEKAAQNETNLGRIEKAKKDLEKGSPTVRESISATTPAGDKASASTSWRTPPPPKDDGPSGGGSSKSPVNKTSSNSIPVAPLADIGPAGPKAVKFEADAKKLADQFGAPDEFGGVDDFIPPPEAPTPPPFKHTLETDAIRGKKFRSKVEAEALAKHLGGTLHQDGPRQWSVKFPEEVAEEVVEPIATLPLAKPYEGPKTPGFAAGRNQGRAPVVDDVAEPTLPGVDPSKLGVGEAAPIAEAPFALGREAATTTPAAPTLPGVAPSVVAPPSAPIQIPGRGASLADKVSFRKANFTPEANTQLDALEIEYQKLNAIPLGTRTKAQQARKGAVGAQMADIASVENAAITARNKAAEESAAAVAPEEDIAAEVAKWKASRGPRGGSTASAMGGGQLANMIEVAKDNPEFAAQFAGGLGGGVIGAATNEDDPLVGAALGAGAGALAGRGIAKVATSDQTIKELTDPLVSRIPNYVRGGLLSHPTSLAWNTLAGPWGANVFGGIEQVGKGIVNNDAVQTQVGRNVLKTTNPLSWIKGMGPAVKEASERINDVEDMGRAGSFISPEKPNWYDKAIKYPATWMLGGDINTRGNLAESGIDDELARKITLTAEPSRALWKNIVNAVKGKSGAGNSDGEVSTISQIMAPFTRTAANIMESGTERTPVLGSIINQMGDASLKIPWQEQMVQEGIGAGVGLGAYGAGRVIPEETSRRFKLNSLVGNLGGQYSLLAGTGYMAGQMQQKDNKGVLDAASKAIPYNYIGGNLPLPTTEPLTNLASPVVGVMQGKGLPPPSEMVPSMFVPKIFPFGRDFLKWGMEGSGADAQPEVGGTMTPEQMEQISNILSGQ